MKYYFTFFCFIVSTFLIGQKTPLHLIPQPNECVINEGVFVLSPQSKIVVKDSSLNTDIDLFNDFLQAQLGFRLGKISHVLKTGNFISFEKPKWEAGFNENYHLNITTSRINIVAEGNGAGVFYALQTLLQLTASSIKKQELKSVTIPCVYIKDRPRYQWRGMHLDVCRHFFPVSFIKRYIDILAMYKMNTFHWHLTEDQGWRIEIKKYPKLTSVGAWRNGTMIGKYSDHKFDTIRYGGFYTQKEIQEVVAYATARHITIVPEIEMPGHSLAAISAYPWLSCTGKPQEVAKSWGVFDDVYCTKDSIFEFLQNVLNEVIALFPGKYIHIGGDECPKTRWKTCANCQSRIKDLRTNVEISNTQKVLDGDLDAFIEASLKQGV